MKRYILAVDQSTTGTKAVLFDNQAKIVIDKSLEHKQYYPQPGWVEQDGDEIYDNTVNLIKNIVSESKVNTDEIAALAITCQTGAFMLWDKNTGKSIYHIIGWQCNRGEEKVNSLSENEKKIVLEKSGTEASAFLPAAKLSWMFENIKDLKKRCENNEILFGTMESWLVWKLTNGKVHASDYCNASITQLLDQKTLTWDKELLDIFNVPKNILPDLYDADSDFGTIDVEDLPKLPITGVIGDSAAALFGQCGFNPGDVKITYGTGSSILMNLGDAYQPPAEGMTTSVGWKMSGKTTYVWEGTAVYTGYVISWLVHDLQMLDNAAQSEEVASTVENANGVYLVPAFSGLGCPYNDSSARCIISNISTGVKKAHIVRAALDCIAYQIRDMVESMQRKTGEAVSYLLVDGGVTKNKLLMQFQSDILGVPVYRSQAKESSALGVFYMAGLKTGMFTKEELFNLGEEKVKYEPKMDNEEKEKLYAGWKKAIDKARHKKWT